MDTHADHAADDLSSFDGRTDLENHLNAIHDYRLTDLMGMGYDEQERLHCSYHASTNVVVLQGQVDRLSAALLALGVKPHHVETIREAE